MRVPEQDEAEERMMTGENTKGKVKQVCPLDRHILSADIILLYFKINFEASFHLLQNSDQKVLN